MPVSTWAHARRSKSTCTRHAVAPPEHAPARAVRLSAEQGCRELSTRREELTTRPPRYYTRGVGVAQQRECRPGQLALRGLATHGVAKPAVGKCWARQRGVSAASVGARARARSRARLLPRASERTVARARCVSVRPRGSAPHLKPLCVPCSSATARLPERAASSSRRPRPGVTTQAAARSSAMVSVRAYEVGVRTRARTRVRARAWVRAGFVRAPRQCRDVLRALARTGASAFAATRSPGPPAADSEKRRG